MKAFLILLLLVSSSLQDVKLSKVKVGENITIKLPKDFIPMTLEDQQQRVYSYRKSLALYTSPDRTTEFGANISYSKFKSGDMELLKEFYKSNILNLYSDVEIFTEEIKTINGREFAVFGFSSLVMDVGDAGDQTLSPISKYTEIAYTVADTNTYLFHLTTPIRQRNQWEDLADRIIESIHIK